MKRKFLLLDASVVASYYAPTAARSETIKRRCRQLIEGPCTGIQPVFLMPNFCIAEVFAVFEKHRWGESWNRQVKHKLSPTAFRSCRQEFQEAIHNGSRILQYALDRYHILCVDLISPINAAYKIRRSRKQKRRVVPASTFDMLILAMGIWLKKQHGEGDFAIITADQRLNLVAQRATSLSLSKQMKSHLQDIAKSLGLTYGPEIYPSVVDFGNAKKSEILKVLPEWRQAFADH